MERTYTLENLKKQYNKKSRIKYIYFWGHTSKGEINKTCFSQWYPSKFSVDGVEYQNTEQYMMAEKARLFNADEILKDILKNGNPKMIKVLGRNIEKFNQDIWNENKYDIVVKGNYHKFSQNSELKKFLISTGSRVLVEASPYDKVWGVGLSADDKKIENPLLWKGENLLGFALMEVRDRVIN